MASIENRSRFLVTVQNRGKLSQSFAHTCKKELQAYISKLKADGYKPKLARTNDCFAIRTAKPVSAFSAFKLQPS